VTEKKWLFGWLAGGWLAGQAPHESLFM